MDKQKFDDLTRLLGSGLDRRKVLRGLLGGAGALVATGATRQFASAQCAERVDCTNVQQPTCDNICPEGSQPGNNRALTGTCCTGNGTCCSNICYEGVCVDAIPPECVTPSDCGAQPDSCTEWLCVEGTCQINGGCPAGELCCPAQGGSCAACCDNGDCPAGTPICYIPGDPSFAYCVECVSAGDCAQPDACTLASCENNICGTASACPAGETCCDVDGVGIDCVNLNGPDDQYCGACGVVCDVCESCVGGQCVPYAEYCPETDECYNTGTGGCCYDEECGDEYCVDGECQLCRNDSDCPDCQFCSTDGACLPILCVSGEVCCIDECIPEEDCCKGVGDYCGLLEVSAAGGDSDQLDCCDGLVCCENWNSQGSVCAECCNDWDCDKGAYCHEGWCEWPEEECDYDKDCPKGTCCCKDGSCSGKCCDKPHPPKPPKPHKPVKPAPEAPVTTLPATGAGPNDEKNSLLGVTALGAAAALYAAKKMRETSGEASTQE